MKISKAGTDHKRVGARGFAVAAASAILALAASQSAYAQVGIGVSASNTPTGTIGHNKQQPDSAAFVCPPGTVGFGLRHQDKANSGGLQSTRGMTILFGAYCANIVPTTSGVTVVPMSTTTPSVITTYNYSNKGPVSDQLCGSNQIIHRLGGYDRDWDQSTMYPAWTSALTMVCDSVNLGTNDWVRINTSGGTQYTVGVIEPLPASNYPGHTERGPFCSGASTELVTGLFAQSGGEGIDGVNVFCGRLLQARFSAVMSFTNFAWSQTRGAGGWLVDLRQGSTLLRNTAGMNGEARTPYAPGGNDQTDYSVPHEVYVLPADDYRATVNARPANIPQESYTVSDTCTTGITLANERDGSCALMITGLPDLTPTVVSPPNTYLSYNVPQDMKLTVRNLGPGASTAANSFRVQATLPTGWTATDLPTNCSLNLQVVTCNITTPLAASTAPGLAGGSIDFTFKVTAVSTASGTFNVPVSVTSALSLSPDYNSANNEAAGTVIYAAPAQVIMRKTWVQANPADRATLTATGAGGGTATVESIADTANETDAFPAINRFVGSTLTLGETLGAANVGAYTASAWACTGGGTLANNQLTIRPEDSGQTITCTITNTRNQADIRVTKTAAETDVLSGSNVNWTITAENLGPQAANNSILRDLIGAGMDCSAPPPPTCSSTGGAQCPSSVSVSALQSGVTIPQFPAGGRVTIQMSCRVTASGL